MNRGISTMLLILTLAVSGLSAADISGEWAVEADVAGNPIAATCSFKQATDTLDGFCKSNYGDSKASGKVDGEKATFQFELMGFVLVFEGTLDGEAANMKGSVSVAGAGDGPFTAKKQ